MVERNTGIDFAAESEITRTRLRLPFWQSGLGFREARERRYIQYVGAVIKCLLCLIDCSVEGDSAMIPGCLPLPSIIERLGAGSFDRTDNNPWTHWFGHEDDDRLVAAGL